MLRVTTCLFFPLATSWTEGKMELGSVGFYHFWNCSLPLPSDFIASSSLGSLVLVCPVGQPYGDRLGKCPWRQAKGSTVGVPSKIQVVPKQAPSQASEIPQRLRQPRWGPSADRGQQQGCGGLGCPVTSGEGRVGDQPGHLPAPNGMAVHLADAKLFGGQFWVSFTHTQCILHKWSIKNMNPVVSLLGFTPASGSHST